MRRGGFEERPVGLGLCALVIGAIAVVVMIGVLSPTVERGPGPEIDHDLLALHEAVKRHLLREGELPGSLADLQDPVANELDPWGQRYLYFPRRDARGSVTDYALASLGPEAGQGAVWVDWGDGGAVHLPGKPERAPSGIGLGHLLPPVLSAGLAGALGLGVWWFGRMPVWRRAGTLEPAAWTPGARRGPRVALHRAASTVHCAWCHDAASELPLIACRGCATLLHAECWGLAGLCPTLGCRRRANMVQVDRSEPVDAVPGGLA